MLNDLYWSSFWCEKLGNWHTSSLYPLAPSLPEFHQLFYFDFVRFYTIYILFYHHNRYVCFFVLILEFNSFSIRYHFFYNCLSVFGWLKRIFQYFLQEGSWNRKSMNSCLFKYVFLWLLFLDNFSGHKILGFHFRYLMAL